MPPSGVDGLSPEALRTETMAARLYHVHEVRQLDIAERLQISQARVSRLLRQAQDHGIVRTVLRVPEGLHPELEELIEVEYGVTDVHVVEVPGHDDSALPYALGRAAATFFSAGAFVGPVVGFTSYSTTLQEMVAGLQDALPRSGVDHVVEMLGGLGAPATQHAATRSTQRLAGVLGAEPVFLRTGGVAAEPALRESALSDAHVQRALRLLDSLDIALVGVGPPGLHSVVRATDTFFSPEQIAAVEARGAVAQLNQRFLDTAGRPVVTDLDDLVVGVTLEQLRRARRRVVVAGGRNKHAAIAAALRGGWVDTLMTDLRTARWLVSALGARQPLPAGRLPG